MKIKKSLIIIVTWILLMIFMVTLEVNNSGGGILHSLMIGWGIITAYMIFIKLFPRTTKDDPTETEKKIKDISKLSDYDKNIVITYIYNVVQWYSPSQYILQAINKIHNRSNVGNKLFDYLDESKLLNLIVTTKNGKVKKFNIMDIEKNHWYGSMGEYNITINIDMGDETKVFLDADFTSQRIRREDITLSAGIKSIVFDKESEEIIKNAHGVTDIKDVVR